MEDRELSCEERVKDHLESRLEDLRELWENIRNNDLSDEERNGAFEDFNNYALSFDYVSPGTFTDQDQGYFRYQISWGGPSDEFRFYVNPDLTAYKVEYWFLDWFDGAGRTLYNEDKALMLEIYEDFRECGTCQYVYEKEMEDL